MTPYIVYTRSWIASSVLYALYCFGSIIVVALIWDSFADLPDVFAVIALVSVFFFPLPLAQVSSRSRIRVVIDKDLLLFHIIRNNTFVPDIPSSERFDDIASIDVKSYLLSGNYLLLQLKDGRKIKLFRTHHLFDRNYHFFDMFVAVRTAWEDHIAAKKKATFIDPAPVRYKTHDAPQEIPAAGTDVNEQISAHGLQPEQHIAAEQQPAPAPQLVPEPTRETYLRREPQRAPEPAATTSTGHWGFEEFKGAQLASLGGILTWSGILFFPLVAMLFGAGLLGVLFAFGLFAILWLLPFSSRLHYFELTPDNLVISNHNLPWGKKLFAIKDIKETKMDTEDGTNCLTLVFRNFGFETYKAPTLSDEKWIALKHSLEARGIKVTAARKFDQPTAASQEGYTRTLIVGLSVYAVFAICVYTLIALLHVPPALGGLVKILDALFLILGTIIFIALFVPWVAAKYKREKK